MKRIATALVATLALGVTGAAANPPFTRGGVGVGGGSGGTLGPAYACDALGSGVCADYSNGQTFIQWPDVQSAGVTDYTKRYRVVRSTAPITAGNFASATVIANYDLPNSGQLMGGNPDVGPRTFNQAHRQSTNLTTDPMQKIPDAHLGGTKTLAYATGLQVYTALANQDAYYAVASTTTTDTSPAFIGSVGPIAESVATPVPIKFYDSLTRASASGKIDAPTNNITTTMALHASDIGGGCAGANCDQGDYWESWGTTNEGWQDGTHTVYDVRLDKLTYRQTTLYAQDRDTVWSFDGLAGLETMHQGLGMTPNPLVGPPNRLYPFTYNRINRFLNFVLTHYGADPNQLHCSGGSMGSWGCANTGMRMASPRFSAVWLSHPQWRMDHFSPSQWAGRTWSGAWPFHATVGAGPNYMGTTATTCAGGTGAYCVTRSDGTRWGGDGGYVDSFNYVTANPGVDLPVAVWSVSTHDGYVLWPDHITMVASMQSAKRGHAHVFFRGEHDTTSARGLVDCDLNSPYDLNACYRKTDFRLDRPYPAFTGSSIDDDMGTGALLANGMPDGDDSGCINCGFRWSFSNDSLPNLAFTVSNAYMGLTPPAPKTTTTTASMLATGNTITVTNGAVFSNLFVNFYMLIGNTAADQEAVKVSSVTGNTVTIANRGMLNTTAKTHNSNVNIRQLVTQPTAPNGGPFSSMTVNITPRRLQVFKRSVGTVLSCTYTPFGESAVSRTPTVDANGLFTLTNVKINSGGSTAIACS